MYASNPWIYVDGANAHAVYYGAPSGQSVPPPPPGAAERSDEVQQQGILYIAPVRNPMRTWHKVLLGTLIVGGAVGVGIFLFARPAKAGSPPVPDEATAINSAVAQLGATASTASIAAVAYAMAYPEGPNPPTGDYQAVWDRIVAAVQSKLGRRDEQPPAPSPLPIDVDDTSERTSKWLSGLTEAQKAELRETIEPSLYDPLVNAAARSDDLAARAALTNIKTAIEKLAAESKFSAFAMYSRLNSGLGEENLRTFRKLLEDTAGPLNLA